MAKENLEQMMEDYSLEAVPNENRRPWTEIAAIQVGIVSSLAVLMTGGLVTFMAGFWMGMLAAFLAFIISTFFIYAMGVISFKEGFSSNIISRAYAFGTRGSAIGSLIWAFLIIGFLGIENVLIGNALLFYLGIKSTTLINIIMYAAMSILWIVLSLFGMKIVARIAQIMIPLLFIVLLYMVFLLMKEGSFSEAFSHGIMIPGMTLSQGFGVAINATITLAGLIAIVATDFTRFARSKRDVAKISVTSGFAMYGATMFFGAIITFFGFKLSQTYFLKQGMDEGAALNAAITNPGITLVLAGGVIGLFAIFFSQSKVQIGNSYEGALALVNLFDAVFSWKPGRSVMVVLANIISLFFIFGNILHYIEAFLTLGSVLLGVWVTIVLTDYYIVRIKLKRGEIGIKSLDQIPNFNLIGLITLVLSTVIGMFIHYQGWFSIPFIISTILAFLMYTALSFLTSKQNINISNHESQHEL